MHVIAISKDKTVAEIWITREEVEEILKRSPPLTPEEGKKDHKGAAIWAGLRENLVKLFPKN